VGNYSLTLASAKPTDRLPVAPNTTAKYNKVTEDRGAIKPTAAPRPSTINTTKTDTVANVLQGFNGWSTTQYNTFRDQAYAMGLTPSKTASKADVLVAWQTVVEESAKQKTSPTELIQKASQVGWNNMKPSITPGDNGLTGTGEINNSPPGANSSSSSQTGGSATTQTTYVSYMDPATAQGTLADAFQRLLGRNPTTKEYQAFLNSLYSYQQDENTGKFEQSTKATDTLKNRTTDKTNAGGNTGATSSTGSGSTTDTNVNQNIVSQRGIGARGSQFLAGQSAINMPEEGAYQAATTYFNAFAKALGGPAAGLTSAAPNNSAP